jgi:hypothetical protein
VPHYALPEANRIVFAKGKGEGEGEHIFTSAAATREATTTHTANSQGC